MFSTLVLARSNGAFQSNSSSVSITTSNVGGVSGGRLQHPSDGQGRLGDVQHQRPP